MRESLWAGSARKMSDVEKKNPACIFEATDIHLDIYISDNSKFVFTSLANDSASLCAFGC